MKNKKSLTPFSSRTIDPETQFWTEVEEKSKTLIANLIEKVLPISATPQNFDLEKAQDYQTLLENLPNS